MVASIKSGKNYNSYQTLETNIPEKMFQVKDCINFNRQHEPHGEGVRMLLISIIQLTLLLHDYKTLCNNLRIKNRIFNDTHTYNLMFNDIHTQKYLR